MSGVFITFEGVEGSGKTTQITLLGEFLRDRGKTVVLTREPGGTPLAEQIRELLLQKGREDMAPLTELFLYEAARAQHVQARIRPALEAGAVVLCDRFADSTTAYQGAGRHLDADTIQMLNRLATGALGPDHTYILDLPADEGIRRAHARGSTDRMMEETLAFHQRIREQFLRLAETEPARITIIDASRSVDLIQDDLRRHVSELLGL